MSYDPCGRSRLKTWARIPELAGLLGIIVALELSCGWAAEPGRGTNTNVPGATGGRSPAADQEAKDKETDQDHLHRIWKALMAYKKAKGRLPDYLSDLVPEFLADKAVLLSPCKDWKLNRPADPRLPVAYAYEFRADHYGDSTLSFREVMEEQMKEFGPVVPILRCFAHGDARTRDSMNIAYSGDYFESQSHWEASDGARALIAKLGLGPGFDQGEFTTLHIVNQENGEVIAGAEVRLTRRWLYMLPLPDREAIARAAGSLETGRSFYALALPDRVLKADAAGTVRVPLGPGKQPPSGVVTVSVIQPGRSVQRETWQQGAAPKEATWRLKASSTMGGVVRNRDGAPLAGAEVMIFGPPDSAPDAGAAAAAHVATPPDARTFLPQLLDTCPTDTAGRWRSEIVPKDSTSLRFRVRASNFWYGNYRMAAEENRPQEPLPPAAGGVPPQNDGSMMDVRRAALLAQEAEFRLEPEADVIVLLRGPDGSPLGGEEVTMSGHGPEPTDLNGRSTRPWSTSYRVAQKMKTGSNGKIFMKMRDAAELTFSATPKNLALVLQTVTVAPGMPVIELKASAPRLIRARVHDGDGKPVEGVKLTFIGWADRAVEIPLGVTNEKGEFAWPSAPAGQLGLTFQKRGFAPSTEWLPVEKTEPVDVELRPQ